MRSSASRSRSSNFRVSSCGASSGTSLAPSACPFVDEEGIHEIEKCVIRSDSIVNPNQQVVTFFRRCLHPHINYIDPRFVPRERLAYLFLNQSAQGGGVRLKHEVVNAATKFGAHLPLARSGR